MDPLNILENVFSDKQELNKLLFVWNTTQSFYPKEKRISTLFEEQVARTPEEIAVICGHSTLSYRALNEKANQLAHYLKRQGLGPETLVAVAFDRTVNLILILLGILKSGAAYLPLDPSYPTERLQFMLEDSQASLLITQTSLGNLFPSYVARILDLEQAWGTIDKESKENLSILSLPETLAYVIYTSGSTGKPKGVMIAHQSLNNFLSSLIKTLKMKPSDKFLAVTTIGFDISGLEIYAPLLTGGSLLLAEKSLNTEPQALEKYILETQPNFMQATPSLWQMLIESHWECPSQMQILCGGEAAAPSIIRSLKGKAAGFWNLYGPTETTIWSTLKYYSPEETLEKVSIGRPIQNTQIYLLDTFLNPVPIGVAGELYIGGTGLGRGYLRRPDLTAERFIPNPFAELEKQDCSQNLRLYRTGDLARYLPEGELEFLGRLDDQVKIRGFRIELGEIEETLKNHPEVAQAAVIAEGQGVDKKLVAYILVRENIQTALPVSSKPPLSTFSVLKGEEFRELTESLRNQLNASLPAYMLPSFFLYVNKLPLLANGKLDRKALMNANPESLSLEERREYLAPETSLEQAVSLIWSRVLGISHSLSLNDNFFKLGGHSLLATRVISTIRREYEVKLTIRTLFEHPSLKAFTQCLASSLEEKRPSLLPTLLPQPKKTPLPLSFAQQRLWFLEQLLAKPGLYNIPIALKLKGNVNPEALENAINVLIQRHESLRTIFPSKNGEAEQVILETLSIRLKDFWEDLSQRQEQKESLLDAILLKEANTIFDLAKGPLLKLKLIHFSETEHVFIITFHHIISDGWSIEVFFKELSFLYQSYLEGKPATLPALPVQYRDFTLWQRTWLQGEILEEQLEFWKKQLAGIPDVLDLPFDQPRSKEPNFRGATVYFDFPEEIKVGLNCLAEKHQCSLFMVLLSAFQVLLYRWSGQKDIVVGSPIANRSVQETEGLIGFFVNTLALRTHFENSESFLEVLRKVKETTLQAFQYQDVPFEQLVENLNITRALNRNPIFQVMFTIVSEKDSKISLEALNVEQIFASKILSKFDLFCTVHESRHKLRIEFEYSTELFHRNTIDKLANYFKNLLNSIIHAPEQNVNDYLILSKEEQQQILIEWNNTKTHYPDKMIHELFEIQALKTPDKIAVIFENQRINYHSLNEKANQLASYLRELGVGPQTIVAIGIERSYEMVIGILAILKAGGAYLPLDLSYPIDRIKFMLEDSGAKVLLSKQNLSPDLPAAEAQSWSLLQSEYRGVLVLIDKEWTKIEKKSKVNLSKLSTKHNLAYIIYTSGSTGKPKGVLVKHSSVVNCIFSLKDLTEVTPNDRYLALTSLSFDVAAMDYYLPFAMGATIILASDLEQKDGFKLISLLNEHNITCVQGTPALFRMILKTEQSWKEGLNIFLAGEALPQELAKTLIKNNKIFNIYGPTEGTIYSTLYQVVCENNISIGRPLPNTFAYILDNHMHPVPINTPGELYIGGINLAEGYLNRPDLSSEKFLPNPFITEEQAKKGINLRLYRTGDLVRFLQNGNIEFLGRIDHQLKIRGFRIELGEIESLLNTFPDISQAVVHAEENENGDKKLIAYIVPQQNLSNEFVPIPVTAHHNSSFSILEGKFAIPLTEAIKKYLNQSLPNYMIPSQYIYLNAIPLTPSKKIDRNALPKSNMASQDVENHITPQTELEHNLHAIWSEVLKINKIDTHANFFSIGGDSIISIQLVSKARQKGIYFTPKDIFNYPSISSLATIAKSDAPKNKLEPEQNLVLGEIPLTPIQHLYFEKKFPEQNHFNQAVLLKANKKIDLSVLTESFLKLINHHDALRLSFSYETDLGWKQVCRKTVDYEICRKVDLSSCSPDELSFRIEKESNLTQMSFDIEKGILFKAILFNCGNENLDRILIVIHHLAIDGVSWRILLEDLEEIYHEVSLAQDTSLSSKTHSYKQWAQALLKHAFSETIKNELSYWQKIEDSIEYLPCDFIKDTNKEPHTHTISVFLPREETELLLQTVPQAYQTEINDILLTALTLCIGDWNKKYDLTLSLEGHGREDIDNLDVSRTIGWFTTLFPIHLDISDPNNLEESIKNIKRSLRKIPNKGINYGILKYLSKLLKPEICQPSLNFNYLGQWDNHLTNKPLFSFSEEAFGDCSSNKNVFSLIDINCEIKRGMLNIFWCYSKNHYQDQTILALSENYIVRLKQIIYHGCQEKSSGNIKSDFDLINVDSIKDELNQILETL